jgi:hypothetical protein
VNFDALFAVINGSRTGNHMDRPPS